MHTSDKNLKNRDYLEDGGVNWVLMLIWILQEDGWDWIHKAQNKDHWGVFVNEGGLTEHQD